MGAILLPGCASARHADTLDDLMPALPPGPGETSTMAPRDPADLVLPTGSVVLTREDVHGLVGRGFGRFLAGIEVSPVVSSGHFVGFRLDRADHLLRWHAAGADLRVGDVITRVNGQSVELPDTALAVFEGLRTAPEVRVDLLRNGSAVTVRQPILDPAPAVLPAPASPPPAPR